MRAQFAFLRVHRPHQEEACRVPHRDAVPLHVAGAQRGGVEEQVHQVVVQQVDLVHVQDAPVRGGQQARLVGLDPLGEGPLDVQRAHQPVLARADRQFDQPGGAGERRGTRLVRAVRAGRIWRRRAAGEPAPGHDLHIGQDRGQRSHHGRLRGALFPAHEHPADARRHRVEHQPQPQLVHAHDRAEREVAHDSSPSSSPSSSR